MNEKEIKETLIYKQLESSRNYYKSEWEVLSRNYETLKKYVNQQDKVIKKLEEKVKMNTDKNNNIRNIVNLIKYHCEDDDGAFKKLAREIAENYRGIDDGQITEYLLAQIGDIPSWYTTIE